MNKRRGCLTSLVVLTAGLLAGVVIGVLIGWVFWPVNYVDTDIMDLRAGYQDDYILMVADTYYLDGDLARAQERLAKLADDGVSSRIIALIKGKMLAGQPPEELAALVMLAQGLHVETQDMLDYIVTATPTATDTPRPERTATPPPTLAIVALSSATRVSTATPAPTPTSETLTSPLAGTTTPEAAETETSLTAELPVSATPSGPDFEVRSQRMMGKAEVGGCDAPAMIYVKTVDRRGRLVDGFVVQAFWDGGKFEPVVTGSKGPGTAEIVASSGDYYVEIVGHVPGDVVTSERSRLLRTAYPSVDDLLSAGYCESLDASQCEALRDSNALCGGNYSYEVYFERNR